MLDHLYHQSISNPLTPTIPSKPGPPLQTASTATVTPAKEIVRNTHDFSNCSKYYKTNFFFLSCTRSFTMHCRHLARHFTPVFILG